ncbi:acyl-CoA thioesterase [Acutalibacter intestini]|uniref:acyl-CoA thioesterase n=1 Tax=Acutalibacter intestini TaxID=3093659 RepID=UPI002AC8F33B|nr:thioesterase family protein [Acutalibacter sp. M00204]
MPTVPYTRPVHYYETDRMDCVHHSNYIRWFEEARVHFMRESGFPYETLEAAGILSPVLSAQANYHAMCRFGDTVEILTQIESYTRTRIAFHYQVRDQATGQPRCDGWTTHCFLNSAGRPVSLKKALPDFHQRVEEFLAKGV